MQQLINATPAMQILQHTLESTPAAQPFSDVLTSSLLLSPSFHSRTHTPFIDHTCLFSHSHSHTCAPILCLQHFHEPLGAAAQRLGVGITALKHVCRAFNIERWPHRKLHSLDHLLRTLEGEHADPEGAGIFCRSVMMISVAFSGSSL
jgi:hypothetical protein